jgi:hypothetical protein
MRVRVRDPYQRGVQSVGVGRGFGRVQPCPSAKLESSFSTGQG